VTTAIVFQTLVGRAHLREENSQNAKISTYMNIGEELRTFAANQSTPTAIKGKLAIFST
jgi:hypothetical protein